METITLQTKNTTYDMAISPVGHLLHLYYGPKTNCDTSYRLQYYDRGFSGNPYEVEGDRTYSLDVLPQEYPVYGNGDYRDNAFNIQLADGTNGCDLRYKNHRIINEKYSLDGLPYVFGNEGEEAYTVEIDLADDIIGLEVTLRYGVIPEKDVITRSAVIKNNSDSKMIITRAFSTSLDLLHGDFDLIHFHGRHEMERLPQREELNRSVTSIGSRRGNSSHQHNPFVIVCDKKTDEDHGAAWGFSMLYSGNFKFRGFKDQFGLTRNMMGIQDDMFDYPLEPGESFETPEVAMIFSGNGLEDLSHKFHKMIQNNVIRTPLKDERCPVLINNWEATYFDFNHEKLLDIAKNAKEVGIEMFVLDDGWFGQRNSDEAGLGDWRVNEDKLGGPLRKFSDEINELGLKFGIWIEPEMVNENSDIYREHPDWAFTIPGRKPIRSRNQLVLDFSRPEVVDYIFEQISNVIDSANIEYIKMDMNRSLYDIYSSVLTEQSFGLILHNYTKGVYRFLEMLTQKYPHIRIEGCSGGGGRFDAGMLYYTPQIWASDNTDAIDRIRIQHGTSFGYPISTVGAHVSAVPNDQTGRTVPLNTRAVVASSGTFGFEFDLSKITEEEKEEVRYQIDNYKRFWPLIAYGNYYRLHDPEKDTNVASWMFVSQDGDEALINAVSLDKHGNEPVNYIKLRGLEPETQYVITSVTKDDDAPEPFISDGNALMHSGIPLPIISGEYQAWQWKLDKIDTIRRRNEVDKEPSEYDIESIDTKETVA